MSDDSEDDKTRPTHARARSEAFRGLTESLAVQLDREADRLAEATNAPDRLTSESCRALARRARVIASRFASWAPDAPWSDAMRADVEEYDELAKAARAYGLEVGLPAPSLPPPAS
jgi:hypothetical protein